MHFLILLFISILIYHYIFKNISKIKLLFNWIDIFEIKMIWIVWVVFLLLFSQVYFWKSDMQVWVNSIENILNHNPLNSLYVYLPVFSVFFAALCLPLDLLGILNQGAIIFTIKFILVFTYVLCGYSMYNISQKKLISALVVVFPSIIFSIFFGANHIFMLALILITIQSLISKKYILGGFFLSLFCYKILTIPLVFFICVVFTLKAANKTFIKQIIVGFLIGFIPNIVYFISDQNYFLKILTNQGNIGGYRNTVDQFHFLFIPDYFHPQVGNFYFDSKLWFFLSLSGLFFALLFYFKKRINFLQGLALSYITITVFAPEPFRIEPLLGLLWLDGVIRKDKVIITLTLLLSFTHFASWLPLITPKKFAWNPFIDRRIFYLGSLVLSFICILITYRIISSSSKKNKLVLFEFEE